MFELDREISRWSNTVRTGGKVREDDLIELEAHLSEEIANLQQSGLSDEESFFVAIMRIGNTGELEEEFSKNYRKQLWKQLWKQLVLEPEAIGSRKKVVRDILLLILLSFLPGIVAKIPALWGYPLGQGYEHIYARNASLFVFPFLAIYLFIKKGVRSIQLISYLAVLLVLVVWVNVIPVLAGAPLDTLTAVHLPILTWLLLVVVYSSKHWRSVDNCMNFIRFTGETFIYSVLILCGGMVLVFLSRTIFLAININIDTFLQNYVFLFGSLGTPVVGAYLVLLKRNIVENIAPVLAKVFSPLFLSMLIAFLLVMLVKNRSPYMERDYLIAFDVLLALVLGMVLFILSSRDAEKERSVFDFVNTGLIVATILVDVIALSAVVHRISSFGVSPNKIAALGENILLLSNLGVTAFLYFRYLVKGTGFRKLIVWQAAFFPVIVLWAAVVVIFFPLIFR